MSIEDRLAVLKNKLRARENVPGYEKNTEAIKQEIDRLSVALDKKSGSGRGNKK